MSEEYEEKQRSIIDITRMDITEYTHHEFSLIIDYIYYGEYCEEWTEEAASMFEKVVAHPDGLSLIHDGDHPYIVMEDLEAWYKEQGLPFVKPDTYRPITDYTEVEFLELVRKLHDLNLDSEYRDFLGWEFRGAIEHPDVEDIKNRRNGYPTTDENTVAFIKQWHKDNNKPCFKPE